MSTFLYHVYEYIHRQSKFCPYSQLVGLVLDSAAMPKDDHQPAKRAIGGCGQPSVFSSVLADFSARRSWSIVLDLNILTNIAS